MNLRLHLIMAISVFSLIGISITDVAQAEENQSSKANVSGEGNNIIYSKFYNVYGNNNLVYGDHLNVLGNKNRVTGDHLVVVGNYNIVAPEKYPKDFNNWIFSLGKAPGEGATVIGDYATAQYEHGTAIGYGAKAYGKSSVALGAFSKAVTLHPVDGKYAGIDNVNGIVSIGAVDEGIEAYYSKDNGFVKPEKYNKFTRQLQGVAAGELSETSTDAVNGSQLHATNQTIIRVEEESKARDTMNAALSALKPLTYDPREPHQFMAGLGSYKNKRAVALGYARYYNESKLAHIGMAYANGNGMIVNAGLSFKFGLGNQSKVLPQYAKGPIASIYVLQEENQVLRKKVDEQEQRIARLETLISNKKLY